MIGAGCETVKRCDSKGTCVLGSRIVLSLLDPLMCHVAWVNCLLVPCPEEHG